MKKLFLLVSIALLAACSSGKKPEDQAFLDSLNSMTLEAPKISDEVISDIVQQIPSPLEISFLLKDAGTKYDNDILNGSGNASKYNSNFEKALNLGVYATDLGYANIYGQNQDALLYLGAIKGLADDLSIGQFFDFNTIKRLASNSTNLDSLLLLTTENFNKINSYLQDNNRSNLSILLLTGGWLEALHITCQVAQKNPGNKDLIEKIGEQKIILDNVKLLLSYYTKDPNIADLYQNILKLEKVFAQIQITYKYAEPTMQEVNGVLVVKDNSTSSINITPENVEQIRTVVTGIRDKIIS